MDHGHILSPVESVILSALQEPVCERTSLELREAELRWHYSSHYFAEAKGEQIIEEMMQQVPEKKLRALLGVQLRDELKHARLYRDVADRFGLDDRATFFADKYSAIVAGQTTFAEQIFVFQMLTESIAAGYVTWRLRAIDDAQCNAADKIVSDDETRHLKMAQPLLSSCPREEILAGLTKQRKKELMREMIEVARESMQGALISNVLGSRFPYSLDKKKSSSELNSIVVRQIFEQSREIDEWIGQITLQ